MIHHIQDMAQPQHVRNDMHFSVLRDLIGYEGEVRCLGGPSFYEHYTNLDEQENRIRPNLPYIGSPGYPAVYGEDTTTFNTPRKFWHTDTGEGLADYTNRGFVSAGTNFFDELNTFPSPSRPISREEDMTAECDRFNVPRPLDAGGNRLPCLMSFIETTVQDKYRKLETTNKRTSTYSIFNAELTQHHAINLYTLNRFNLDAAHQFLIPRAVAYSAGLINYFLRGVGKITLEPNPHPQPGEEYLLKNLSDERLTGKFTIYYDEQNGERVYDHSWPTDGTLWIEPHGQRAIPAPGDGFYHTVNRPGTPKPKEWGKFLLVFTGEMGHEGDPTPYALGSRVAIAANTVELPLTSFLTPTGRLWYNDSGNFNGWSLIPESGLQYGNVDWRGTAGSVSWVGPHGRHVGKRPTYELSPQIFSGGQVLALAPGPVIGAAIQQQPHTGALTLLAVVATLDQYGAVTAETVYATPLPLLDPVDWRRLGSFQEFQYGGANAAEYTGTPGHYFFNAAGTQAVNIKPGSWREEGAENAPETQLRLLLLDVGPDHAVFQFGPKMTGTQTRSRWECVVQEERVCRQWVWQKRETETLESIAAEYRGAELVTLQSTRIVREDGHGTETEAGAAEWRETARYDIGNWAWVEMADGWRWPWREYHQDRWEESTWTADPETRWLTTSDEHAPVYRELWYVDLRPTPAVVGYYEHPWSQYDVYETYRQEGPTQVLRDSSTWQGSEQVAWEVAGQPHVVAPWQEIGDEAVFIGEQGTFAVGGTPSAPQVIANHRFPTTEVNFMYPSGDLRHYGGGPVGR